MSACPRASASHGSASRPDSCAQMASLVDTKGGNTSSPVSNSKAIIPRAHMSAAASAVMVRSPRSSASATSGGAYDGLNVIGTSEPALGQTHIRHSHRLQWPLAARDWDVWPSSGGLIWHRSNSLPVSAWTLTLYQWDPPAQVADIEGKLPKEACRGMYAPFGTRLQMHALELQVNLQAGCCAAGF